jgi:hypothetical protein
MLSRRVDSVQFKNRREVVVEVLFLNPIYSIRARKKKIV